MKQRKTYALGLKRGEALARRLFNKEFIGKNGYQVEPFSNVCKENFCIINRSSKPAFFIMNKDFLSLKFRDPKS